MKQTAFPSLVSQGNDPRRVLQKRRAKISHQTLILVEGEQESLDVELGCLLVSTLARVHVKSTKKVLMAVVRDCSTLQFSTASTYGSTCG